MHLSRHSLLALIVVLLAVPALGGAFAQTSNERQEYDWKPFLPPLVPIPPNAQVNPGSLTAATAPRSSAAPQFDNSPIERPRAPGLTITVPTR